MAVIEFRYLLKRYTMTDAENGVTPVRQMYPGGRIRLFAPPVLQWRARERSASPDGKVSMEWGPFTDVLYVREGDDEPAAAAPEPPKAA
jgi:hypothetical protein